MFRREIPCRVSIIAGIVRPPDAISETVLADLDAVDSLAKRNRINIEARVFCSSASVPDTRIVIAPDWRQIVRNQHFRNSDLLIYHFGIFGESHNSIQFARRDGTVVAYFHNVTPPQHCRREDEELQHRSFQQIELLRNADQHLAASEFSAGQLRKLDLGAPVSVAPLFGRYVNGSPTVREKSHWRNRELRLLFVGRFARSKGLVTLFEALSGFSAKNGVGISCTLSGILDYSDQNFLQELQTLKQCLPRGISAEFSPNLSASQLVKAYRSADCVVLPSLHEGFGMPVVESFSWGTPVICSDAGALPEISNGLGYTFKAGDTQALKCRLEQFVDSYSKEMIVCDRGAFSVEEWSELAGRYSEQFSRAAYIDRTRSRLAKWLSEAPVTSNHYRQVVKDNAEALFGSQTENVSPADAAVVGAIRALDVDRLSRRDPREALRLLLGWAFPHEQSEADLVYWTQMLEARGFRSVLKDLAESVEVRNSPARIQIGPFIESLLAGLDLTATVDSKPDRSRRPLTEEDPELRLLLGSEVSNLDFIREAYRLVLGREPDDQGLADYLGSLVNGLARTTLIKSLLDSEERRRHFGPVISSPNGDASSQNPGSKRESATADLESLERLDVPSREFVTRAYQVILGREPDRAGLAAYETAVDSLKLTRKGLIAALLRSEEYSKRLEGR